MSAMLEAKTAMRQLATKAETVIKNPRLTTQAKTAALDKIEVELKQHKQTISMHESANRLGAYGSSAPVSRSMCPPKSPLAGSRLASPADEGRALEVDPLASAHG